MSPLNRTLVGKLMSYDQLRLFVRFQVLAVIPLAIASASARSDTIAVAIQSKSTGVALEKVLNAVARERGVSTSDIVVKVLTQVDVPGVMVFRASLRSSKGRSKPSAPSDVGIVYRGEVEFDWDKAINTVMRVWHYGSKRTVPATAVAEVVGFLEGDTSPVLNQQEIDSLPENWRKFVFLPRETMVDGLPAVEYWNRYIGGIKKVPLWRTQIIIKPNG